MRSGERGRVASEHDGDPQLLEEAVANVAMPSGSGAQDAGLDHGARLKASAL